MGGKTIAQLIDGLPMTIAQGSASCAISDITEDSRTVAPGSLFIARPGEKSDGRKFVGDAIKAGAVVVLANAKVDVPANVTMLVSADVEGVSAMIAERFFDSPTSKLKLIGITGTNGKTTTAYVIQQLLNRAGIRCGLIGTVQIDDGAKRETANLTTPPAIELSRWMSRMVANGCRACVMEASSHALHQKRTAGLNFSIGVFTNLTGDHLDYHRTMDEYRSAKALLFQRLPAQRDGGVAIINVDDESSEAMIRATKAKVLRCSERHDPLSLGRQPSTESRGSAEGEGWGEGAPAAAPSHDWHPHPRSLSLATAARERGVADCSASIDRQTITHTSARFAGPWGAFDVDLPLIGAHNVMNALQAMAVAHALGVDGPPLHEMLSQVTAPPGRLEPVTTSEHPFAVLVDYAHTDDALENVLRALRPIVPKHGRLRVVFGCGGDRDKTKRPRMARVACKFADDVIITSDNPRTEDPQAVIDEIRAGLPYNRIESTLSVIDRAEAINEAISRANEGDIVLIAGKGHEDYQIIGATKRPFDDRKVAAEALRARFAKPQAAAVSYAGSEGRR